MSVCIIGHGRVGKFFEALLMPMKGIRVFIKHKHEPRYPAVDIFLICVQDQWVPKGSRRADCSRARSGIFGGTLLWNFALECACTFVRS